MNNIKYLLCLILIQSCSLLPTKTEYVRISYPILVCPESPVLVKPDLYINKLTQADAKNYGKVARYYQISLIQLSGYIKELELVVDRYNKTSESYKGLEAEVNKMSIKNIKKDLD